MGCSGPEALHCEQCKEAGIMKEGNMICLKECPPNKPYVYSKDRLCYNYDRDWTDAMKKKAFIAVSVFAIIAILIIIVCCGKILLKFRKKYKIEKNMHLPEIPEYDKNSIIKRPNMNQIRLISIDELVMPSPVQVLGEGAFGVVFAGKFKTQDKNGKKISLPVAIKAINVGNVVGGGSAHVKIGNTEAEMIEEAGIMAKLHHEHLLPLVGISFAKGVKIITPLRPLKSLNKFLQEHQHSLGARDLMVYCYQISSAMEYLARNKIVHCDLAARNVLMKRYNHVEVTDFGLARILEGANPTSTINNKIPVKWMPIECLANRKHTIYSEATDVWSFGVTCWEILVYGDMPYKLVTLPKGRDQAESLFQYLDNGGRLKQPSNCSQELYQLLLTCRFLIC
uniref:receptor protein-tyrosine kinase n=1 Tax=Acrobeloides nanus TaxID=290746 RepID=A0A914CYJ7_9BILA